MSARLMKKVLKVKEQESAQEQQPQNNSEDDSKSSDFPGLSRNPFDILNEDDHSVQQENELDTAGGSTRGDISSEHLNIVETTANVLSSNQNSKKKKKKKSKDSALSGANVAGESCHAMLENLSVKAGTSFHKDITPFPTNAKSEYVNNGERVQQQCVSSMLQVDPKFLSAENELRRIFGSRVVNSFEKGHQTGSSRQIRGIRRGSHIHRRTILVSPSEHWPRWDGSLSMELLETRDGVHYFRYVYSSSYREAQEAFEAAKEMHDLNGIGSILMRHPYHIDSLVTLSEYFTFAGEHQMSADAIAKCLYALECTWPAMFSPLQGNFRVKYCHETNKLLLRVLFIHMKNMDSRGCHRSALEICKLLLSLDPDDPMGAMFCIDYYSLRAEEYAWLEQFCDKYRSDSSLWLFPNFSYSLAICRYYLENEERAKNAEVDIRKASSTDLMKQALMLHPSVLKKLVAKVPLKDQVWTSVVRHSFFESDETGVPSLDHLISIYVERSYIIWRLPDLQKFLRETAILVIEMLENNKANADDWACVRKEAFSHEKNEYSHLLTSDFSDSLPAMPPDNLQNFIVDNRREQNGELPNFMVDQRREQNGGVIANLPVETRVPRNLLNRNAFAVLFESLLPWIHYERGNGHDYQHEEDRGQLNED